MSRAKNQLEFEIFKKKAWRGFSIVLAIFFLYGMHVHQSRIQEIDVHIPPKLSGSVTQKHDHIPRPNVYLFVSNVVQFLNNWEENGEDDFLRNIEAYRHYLTPQFKALLMKLYELKKGENELYLRIRGVQEIFGHGYDESRVVPVSDGVWNVTLDLNLKEWFQGMVIKEANIIYQIRVVRYDINRDLNPFQMALDGFVEPPKEIQINKDKLAQNK